MEPAQTGLIERIEDEFQISISEEEMLLTHTAGELHRLVMSKLIQESLLIPTRALYVVRRSLADISGVPRRSIRPATSLEGLVPADDRSKRWSRMVDIAGVQLPRLQHSSGLKDRILLISMAISVVPVAAIWWAVYALDWLRGIYLALFVIPAALGFLLLESRINKHFLEASQGRATELPCDTVRELADSVMEMNSAASLAALGPGSTLSGEMAWKKVTDLVRRTCSMGPDPIVAGTVIPELTGRIEQENE